MKRSVVLITIHLWIEKMIWVYTVWSDLSIQIVRIIMVQYAGKKCIFQCPMDAPFCAIFDPSYFLQNVKIKPSVSLDTLF